MSLGFLTHSPVKNKESYTSLPVSLQVVIFPLSLEGTGSQGGDLSILSTTYICLCEGFQSRKEVHLVLTVFVTFNIRLLLK